MANPQIEKGHTLVANELAEAWARFRLAGEEWQVLWVIVRKTYGWHKKRDAISLSQFAQLTGIKKPHIIRAIKKLEGKKVILVTTGEAGTKTYAVQKDFDLWKTLPKKGTLPRKGTNVAQEGNESLSKKVPTKATSTQNQVSKEKYAEAVFLSKEEYQKLLDQFGRETTAALIAKLNNHKLAKGMRYKSDYHAILSWVVDAVLGKAPTKVTRLREGT